MASSSFSASFRRLAFSGVALFGFLSIITSVALAQSPEPTTEAPSNESEGDSQAVVPLFPNVYVTNIQASATSPREVRGSFTAQNTDKQTVPGLEYEILLLETAPTPKEGELVLDTANILDRQLIHQPFTLAPEEKKQISFTYSAPGLPKGTYRLRIQLRTTNDQDLGWDDATIELGDQTGFTIVQPLRVEVQSTDPISHETRNSWLPLEGVNVDPGAAVTLRADLKNIGTTALSGTNVLTTRRLITATSDTSRIPAGAVTVAPGATQTISLPFSAPKTPGAYSVHLAVEDAQGNRLSGLGEFRVVVRGASASVVRATVEEIGYRKGDNVSLQVIVVGPADRSTVIDGSVEVKITDTKGAVASASTPVHLDLSALPGTVNLVLSRDIEGEAHATILLKDAGGTVLETYTLPLGTNTATTGTTLAPHPAQSTPTGYLFGLLLLLLFILGLVFWWIRSRRSGASGSSVIMPLVVGFMGVSMLGLFLLWSSRVEASGIQFQQCFANGVAIPCPNNNITLFIREPNQNQEVSIGQPIRYNARMRWTACKNLVNEGTLSVYTHVRPDQVITQSTISNLRTPADYHLTRNVTFIYNNAGGSFTLAIPDNQLQNVGRNIGRWEFKARGRRTFAANEDAHGVVWREMEFVGNLPAIAGTPGQLVSMWSEALGFHFPRNGGLLDDHTALRLVPPPPRPTVDLKANGSDGPFTVIQGDTAKFTWTSTGATSCPNFRPSCPSEPGSGGSCTEPNNAAGRIAKFPTIGTFAYTLECTGPGLDGSGTATCADAAVDPRVEALRASFNLSAATFQCTPLPNGSLLLGWNTNIPAAERARYLAETSRGDLTHLGLRTTAIVSNATLRTFLNSLSSTWIGAILRENNSISVLNQYQAAGYTVSNDARDLSGPTLNYVARHPQGASKLGVNDTSCNGGTCRAVVVYTKLPSDTVTVIVQPPGAPLADLKVNGQDNVTLVEGSQATLTWTTQNVNTASLAPCPPPNGGPTCTSLNNAVGEVTDPLTIGTHTFTLNVTGNGSLTATDTVTVTVTAAPPGASPTPLTIPPGQFQEVE